MGFPLLYRADPGYNGQKFIRSAARPLWSALITRLVAALPAARHQRFLAPLLYQAGPTGTSPGQSALRDITTGQNASSPDPAKGHAAGPGYDAASGWGAPDGEKLLGAL